MSESYEPQSDPMGGPQSGAAGRSMLGITNGGDGADRRHLDHAINRPVRSDPYDASAVIPAIPQIAFGIDRRTIRKSAIEILKERGFVADLARGRIVVIHNARFYL